MSMFAGYGELGYLTSFDANGSCAVCLLRIVKAGCVDMEP